MTPLVLAGGLGLIGVGDILQVGLGGNSDWPRILALDENLGPFDRPEDN